MRDEGVIYVVGHPLLNRRCTRLRGCICLWNDLYCVRWGVRLFTHSVHALNLFENNRLAKVELYGNVVAVTAY